MPTWTKEQNDAINLTGENIIVSAGAGSGKTAVLSERVINKLLNGVDVDQLLILTFTRAAASEMKERIRKKIKKNPSLSNQLKKIDSSYITTFDSFSLSLVKKYHYLLNVKKDIDIIESNLLNLKVNAFLDIIMEEEYQEGHNDFVTLINDFCLKDDFELKKLILLLNDKLNLKYDKEEYLNNYLDTFYNQNTVLANATKYLDEINNIINVIDQNIRTLSNEIDIDYYNKLTDIINPLIISHDYNEIRINVNNILRLPNLPKGSSDEAKKIKENISSNIKKIKELTRFSDFDSLINTYMMTKPYLKAIIRIINKLDKMVNEYKFQNDLYDFVDISKMAIKLVKENENIRHEIKYFFKEIMIDEYQDTSDLQEEFIHLIENNNLYMVGDVKQSIYRFRNANPDIFRNKYNLYKEHLGGIKIDLLKNFRSREEVLNNINLIFNYIMTDLIGGANYIKEHQMVFGNTSYNNEGLTKQNNNFEVYSYDYDKDGLFKEDEIEAFIIANDIKEKVNNHYQIFDKDNMILRDITYSDFSILVDRSTNFILYNKVFLYHQIPLTIYKDEYLTNSALFSVIRNIFKIINLVYDKNYNVELKYCFLSIGRSFLFKYDDEYLFDVLENNSLNETDILKKINNIVITLSTKSIRMILDEIINEFNIYDKLRSIPEIENNMVKIDYLYTLANNLNKMGYSIKEFDSYLEDIINNKNDIRFSLNEEVGNSVKIMTIHKSKGLEYHICYFPGLTKKFNDGDIKEKIVYDNRLGIVTPYFDSGIDDTFYHELFKNNYYNDEISEKIRLFYVALTRAKEKMIFILPDNLKEERYINDIVDDDIRLSYRSFADILYSIKSKIVDYYQKIDLNKLNLSSDYNFINSKNIFDNIVKSNEIIDIVSIPLIDVITKEDKHYSKANVKLFTKDEINKMEFGTKIHYYLETIDFNNPDLSNIPELFRDKINNFINSDLMKNISEAKIYQEYEFNEDLDTETKHGIIDLMLEYSNYIDIIDYKLKNIQDEAYIKQLYGYRDYIKKLTNKEINVYLYSIIDSKYQKL